jgi:2-keto-3-deoxy-L-rhamnonate aldolase RhmA
VGPHDLSVTLGVPEQYDHPRFEEALGRVVELCNARKVPVAVHLHNQKLATRWMERGVRFVLHSSDTRALAEGFRADFDVLRQFGAKLSGGTAATTEVKHENI